MSTTQSTPPTARLLTPTDERRIAVEAGCDPRTVRRYLAGESTVSTVSDRIRRSLDALGCHEVRRRVMP